MRKNCKQTGCLEETDKNSEETDVYDLYWLSPKSLLKINICYAHNFISLNRKNGISFTPLN